MTHNTKAVSRIVEKAVRSLEDLEEALTLATRDGGCRIRVGDRVVALLAPGDISDDEPEQFLTNPIVVERLNQAVRSLDSGRGIPHEEALKRLQ